MFVAPVDPPCHSGCDGSADESPADERRFICGCGCGRADRNRLADAKVPAALRAAERHGLTKSIMSPVDEVPFWVEKGVELIYIASDIACMKTGAKSILDMAKGQV